MAPNRQHPGGDPFDCYGFNFIYADAVSGALPPNTDFLRHEAYSGYSACSDPFDFVDPDPSDVRVTGIAMDPSWWPGLPAEPNDQAEAFFRTPTLLVTTTPEPATIALLALGLGALAFAKRRRT